MAIITKRLTLSIIGEDDLQDVFETMNHKDTAQIISFMTWPMTIEQAENWCRKSDKGYKQKTDSMFIARDAERLPVGCIGLHNINDNNKNGAEIGYWITPSRQGKGYASECVSAVINHAFSTLELDSLWATAIPENLKSRRILEKHGFKVIDQIVKPVAAIDKVADRYLFELRRHHLDE